MAITRIGQNTGTTTASLPALAVGDLIVVCAYRDGSATAPTVPSAFSSGVILTGGSNTNSMVVAALEVTSGSEVVGTWTNATSVIAAVYRGVDLTAPGGSVQSGGSSTTMNYGSITVQDTTAGNCLLAFGGHRSANVAITNPPSGFSLVTSISDATDEMACFERFGVAAGSTALGSVSVGGTASGYRTAVFEMLPLVTGTTYSDSASESVTAGESASQTWTAGGLLTEAATAGHAQTATLNAHSAASEGVTAGESSARLVSTSGAIGESVSAGDSAVSGLAVTAAASEASTASDASARNVATPGGVSETASATEATVCLGLSGGSISEAGSATDSVVAAGNFGHAKIETATAGEASGASRTTAGAHLEATAAAENAAALLLTSATRTEAATAAEVSDAMQGKVGSLAEAADATDHILTARSVAAEAEESAVAGDGVVSLRIVDASGSEQVSAGDTATTPTAARALRLIARAPEIVMFRARAKPVASELARVALTRFRARAPKTSRLVARAPD